MVVINPKNNNIICIIPKIPAVGPISPDSISVEFPYNIMKNNRIPTSKKHRKMNVEKQAVHAIRGYPRCTILMAKTISGIVWNIASTNPFDSILKLEIVQINVIIFSISCHIPKPIIVYPIKINILYKRCSGARSVRVVKNIIINNIIEKQKTYK